MRTVTSCPLSRLKKLQLDTSSPYSLLSKLLDEVTDTEQSIMKHSESLAILRLDSADRAVLRVAGDHSEGGGGLVEVVLVS